MMKVAVIGSREVWERWIEVFSRDRENTNRTVNKFTSINGHTLYYISRWEDAAGREFDDLVLLDDADPKLVEYVKPLVGRNSGNQAVV